MPRSDLRSLFRSNQPDLAAEEVFADRQDEWGAVVRSLVAHIASVQAADFSVEDFERPRRNVLAFYGIGGIGKSTLSRNLERHLGTQGPGVPHWTPVPAAAGRLLPVRIDLSRTSGIDFEDVMLALRLAVAPLGRPMAAFDLALRRYWEANHPGDSLEEYLRRNNFLRRFASSVSLPEQIQSALGDLAQSLSLPGSVGNLVGQSLRVVVGALREHRQTVRTLARCSRLADILEADQDLDTLSYCAHLLAWDLASLPTGQAATPVVLLDTFEDVGDRTHRDLERLLQRVVWLMPNALFVVTGRNRLQWDDEKLDGQLDWTGPHAWPYLAPGSTAEPRQHRIGYLSAQDCEKYLCQRLTREGEPVMDRRVRQQVIARSHGLPLYLDLAVMRFLDLYQRSGRQPSVQEFNLDFPALVARTFRDLSAEERHVLRAVSLLDSFSVDLATAAAGLELDAPALQLVERPFIDEDPGAPWPYHVHTLVREAVRDADATTEDRWSSADWRRAAQRAFSALGAQLPAADVLGQRQQMVSCLTQGLRLARDYRLELGWLVDAAYRYAADFVWEAVEIPVSENGATGPARTPAEALAETVTAIARRQRVHRQQVADQLSEILASSLLPPDAEDLARYHLAECQRDLGLHAESAAGMRQVAAGSSPLAPSAARGLVHLARRLGDFPAVQAATETLGRDSRYHRALGDLWWTQGNIALACAAYASARTEAEQQGALGEAALSQACLAFAAAFQDRARAEEQIARAEQLLRNAHIRWARLQTRIAILLRDAGTADDVPARIAQAVCEADDSGLTSSAAYAHLALCFHHAVRGSADELATARAALRERVHGAEFAYLVEISHFMDHTEPDLGLPRAAWVDGTDATAERWHAIVANRRAESSVLRPE
ncbi:ATP/GTP-binding protein [Streptomyces sp. NPDC014006]|uniref:ATP/GTP-binding protein n=1 Tax=Streptomyces sp. NPDC014006 TaxID=3364870 RepID=UPI0036FE253A